MSERRNWWAVVGGAVFAYLAAWGFFSFWPIRSGGNPATPLAGVGLLAVVAIAFFLLRRVSADLALGLAGGYGILTLISGGQCTIWAPPDDAAFFGFFAYPMLVVLALVVVATVEIVGRVKRRRR